MLIHIHFHARSQRKHSNAAASSCEPSRGRNGSDPKPGFIESLRGLVSGLTPGKFQTEWMRYYEKASHYSSAAEASKKETVSRVLEQVAPQTVYDLGGNIGEYSRLATSRGIDCVCCDIDPCCVHNNYERARADLLMALALIHHLRITANAPFRLIAPFLARLGRRVLIEYVPKDDVKVQVLLRGRKDTFFDYTEEAFRAEFETCFQLEQRFPVSDSGRTLYLFRALV